MVLAKGVCSVFFLLKVNAGYEEIIDHSVIITGNGLYEPEQSSG
jgi:hypothetical protein